MHSPQEGSHNLTWTTRSDSWADAHKGNWFGARIVTAAPEEFRICSIVWPDTPIKQPAWEPAIKSRIAFTATCPVPTIAASPPSSLSYQAPNKHFNLEDQNSTGNMHFLQYICKYKAKWTLQRAVLNNITENTPSYTSTKVKNDELDRGKKTYRACCLVYEYFMSLWLFTEVLWMYSGDVVETRRVCNLISFWCGLSWNHVLESTRIMISVRAPCPEYK